MLFIVGPSFSSNLVTGFSHSDSLAGDRGAVCRVGGPTASQLKKFVKPCSDKKNFVSLYRGVWGHAPPKNFEN